MKPELFTSPAGELVPVPRSVAFVPDPLPPKGGLAFSGELLQSLSEAEHQLGRLDGVGQRLSDPDVLIRPFLRREAVLSNRIEGTHASYQQVVLFEAATRTNDRRDFGAYQVVNYVQALDFGLRQCAMKKGIGHQLICDLHERLMRGESERNETPGKPRSKQVHVRGSDISMAEYVPAPPAYVSALLDRLEVFMNQPSTLPLLIRLALIHYQFEAIHPFSDGNGRLGRLLITLLLCAEKRLQHPLLYLSAYFQRNYAEYCDRLLRVSQRSEWLQWIIFFLNGVKEEARDAVNRTSQLFELHEEYEKRFATSRASAPTKLIKKLFEAPVITIPLAQEILDLSYPSAKQVVMKLIDQKILIPLDYPARAQYFLADEIISIIEEPVAT